MQISDIFKNYTFSQIDDKYIVEVYQNLSSEIKRLVVNFWLNHQAITNVEIANKRVDEVVFILADEDGKILGVNTVAIYQLSQKGRYYYYRMFFSPKVRGGYVAPKFTLKTRDYLLTKAETDDCQGFVIATENRKMMQPGWKRWYQRNGFQYLGQNPQACDVWLTPF